MPDRMRSVQDPTFRHAGTGMAQTFLCPMCAKPRAVLGRRLRRFRGRRQWVCKGCAPNLPPGQQ